MITVLPALGAIAQDGNSNQPVLLHADYIELDFNTGERLYQGNVVLTQGNITIECDEMTTTYSNENELLDALCVGAPGMLRKEPEEKGQEPLIGSALSIAYDQQNNRITLLDHAQLERGRLFVHGHRINYDLNTGKTIVKSDQQKLSETNDPGDKSQNSSQAKVVIQPQQDPDD